MQTRFLQRMPSIYTPSHVICSPSKSWRCQQLISVSYRYNPQSNPPIRDVVRAIQFQQSKVASKTTATASVHVPFDRWHQWLDLFPSRCVESQMPSTHRLCRDVSGVHNFLFSILAFCEFTPRSASPCSGASTRAACCRTGRAASGGRKHPQFPPFHSRLA